MKWVLTYALACTGGIVAVLALLWALSGFSTGGLGAHGIAALVLGVTFSVLLAVALMGLVFYSSRSGRDEQAHDADRRHRR